MHWPSPSRTRTSRVLHNQAASTESVAVKFRGEAQDPGEFHECESYLTHFGLPSFAGSANEQVTMASRQTDVSEVAAGCHYNSRKLLVFVRTFSSEEELEAQFEKSFSSFAIYGLVPPRSSRRQIN